MKLSTPHEVCPPSPVETLLAVLGELTAVVLVEGATESELLQDAVAFAEGLIESAEVPLDLDPGLKSADTPSPDGGQLWRQQFTEMAACLPEARVRMWLVDNCVASDLMEDDLLVGGLVMRRLDAQLDLVDAPFCAADAQGLFAHLAQSVAASKVSSLTRGTAFAASLVTGAVGGAFGFMSAGTMAGTGADYLIDRGGRVDQLSEDAARLLLAAYAALAGDGGETDALAIWRHIFDVVLAHNAEIGKRRLRAARGTPTDLRALVRDSRVVEAAERDLRESLTERGCFPEDLTAPDVVGWSLNAAKYVLEACGWVCADRDASEQDRWRMNAENWRVCAQLSDDMERRILLDVRKYGE